MLYIIHSLKSWNHLDGCLRDKWWVLRWIYLNHGYLQVSRRSLSVRIFSPTFHLPGEGTEGSMGIKPWALNLHTCPQSIPKPTSFTYFDFISLSLSLPLCSHFRHQDVATCHMMPNCGCQASPQAAHSCECSSSQPACLAGKVREVSRCLWKRKLRWETTIASNNIQSFQPCSKANLIHNIHTIYLRYGNTPTEQSQS